MHFTVRLLGVVALVSLTACVQTPVRQAASSESAPTVSQMGVEQVRLRAIKLQGASSVPQSVWLGDSLASLYLNEEGRIAFSAKGKTQLLDEGAPVLGGRYLSLRKSGHDLYASWWSHEKEKAIYFRVSHDGGQTFEAVQFVNSNHGALPPPQFVVGDGGVLAAAYQDEREPGFQVYFNRTDNAQNWIKPDVRLDQAKTLTDREGKSNAMAIEPHMVRQGDALVVTWTEAVEGENGLIPRVVARTSPDMGKTWSEVCEIYRGQNLPSAIELLSIGNDVYLAGHWSGLGVKLYRSIDLGKTWNDLGVAQGSEEFVNSQLKLAADGKRLYLVYTSQKEGVKFRLHAATFALEENKWLGPQARLDIKEFDVSRSLNADLAVLEDGVVAAVWEDYRNIRPNIYLSATRDGGKAWSVPVSLEVAGRYASVFPSIVSDGKRHVAAFSRHMDERRTKVEYVAVNLGLNAQGEIAGVQHETQKLSVAEKEARLKERVNAFWNLRVQNKHVETYDFFDPLYRSKVPREIYATMQGNVTFYSFSLDLMKIQDNVAAVSVKNNFEVKEMFVQGQKFSQPRRDGETITEWAWIYDDWYIVYKNVFGDREVDY